MKYSPQNYALRLLELRDRSEAEIRKKMKEKGFLAEDIEKTVRWLKEKDFVNDEKFIQNYLKSHISNLRTGKRKLLFKLMQFGIDKELIDKYSGEIDEEDEFAKAKELAEKWLEKHDSSRLRSNNKYSSSPGEARVEKPASSRLRSNNNYHKLGQYLAGKGYEIAVVKQVLNEVLK